VTCFGDSLFEEVAKTGNIYKNTIYSSVNRGT
jgi:hypothetical protein